MQNLKFPPKKFFNKSEKLIVDRATQLENFLNELSSICHRNDYNMFKNQDFCSFLQINTQLQQLLLNEMMQ